MITSDQNSVTDTKCDNCGEELLGTFCWVCGQRDTHYNRSVFKVIRDFFKEMFDVDSRVFTTLSTLFFRPGKLSIQFRDNKRAGYVTPIRLYLFSSLVFFFLVAIISRSQNVQLGKDNYDIGIQTPQEVTSLRTNEEIDEYLTLIRRLVPFEDVFESAKNVLKGRIVDLAEDPWSEKIFALVDQLSPDIGLRGYDPRLEEEILSAEEAHKRMKVVHDYFPNEDDKVVRSMGEAIVKSGAQGQLLSAMKMDLSRRYVENGYHELAVISILEKRFLRWEIIAAYNGKSFVEDLTENLPLMMFMLLPIFVLVVALLSLGKGIRVVFQLIFAMHVHALAFFTLTVSVLLSFAFTSMSIPLAGVIVPLILVSFIVVHIYLSFKNFYGSGHIVSLLKFFVLTLVYGVVLGISVLSMAIFLVLRS